jgi:hypothetical protein
MDVKKELLKLVAGIGYVVVIITIIRLFRFGFWEVYAFFMILGLLRSLGMMIWKKQKPTFKNFILAQWKPALWLLGILVFFRFLFLILPSTFWGFVLGCSIIAGVIIWRRRKKWLEVKWRAETMLFGKPLYKYRKAGQRPPKIKIVTTK